MPAVDYDYNYYDDNRKMNKTANANRATNRVGSSVSMTSNTRKNYNPTRQATKEQVRRAMYDTPKKQVNGKQRKNVSKDNDMDIPVMKQGKKVLNSTTKNNNLNVKSSNKNNNAKPAEMKLKKPELTTAQKKKAKAKAVSRVKNVIYLLIGFGIAFLICYRYSLINEKFNQLENTKKQLATVQTVNEQIQADIDSQTDLSYIENYAKYQLGMQKPSNSQIVYVNVEKEDKILTPITIEEDSNKTWLDQLYEEIVKLFE